jgi:hypothetical protein
MAVWRRPERCSLCTASSTQVLIAACCDSARLLPTCMLGMHSDTLRACLRLVTHSATMSLAVVSTVERVTPPARVSASLERMTAGFDPDRWAWREASRQHGSNALLAAAQSSACLQRLNGLPLSLPASCEPTPCCCVPRGPCAFPPASACLQTHGASQWQRGCEGGPQGGTQGQVA